MKIWLLNTKKNKWAFWVKRVLEEWKKLWLRMKFVSIEDIELVISSDGEETLFIKNKVVKLPNIVLPRNDTSYQIKSITDFLENKGVHIVNSNVSRFLAKDKFLSLQKLALNAIPVPKTILLKWVPNIPFIEEQLQYPIIIKKIEWSQWRWIIKVNNMEDLEDMIEMLEENMKTLNRNLILQEYIWEKSWQDLRFFVVWSRIIGSMLRKWKEWDFKSNFSGWGKVFDHIPTEREEILALDSTSIIWLDIAWVDMLFDKDNGYKICEVNASPWFEWLEKATWKNIAAEIVNYIAKRYNIKTSQSL